MQLHPILFARQRCLGLHDDDDPEEPGQKYGQSTMQTAIFCTLCMLWMAFAGKLANIAFE